MKHNKNESIETLIQKAKGILSSGMPWTDEFKQKIVSAIDQRDEVALIKVIKSSVTKSIID